MYKLNQICISRVHSLSSFSFDHSRMAAARPNFSTPLKAVTPDPTPPKTVPSGPTLPKAGLPSGGVSVDLASAVNYSVDNVPAPHHPANKAPVVNVMSSGAVPCANANKKYCHVEPVVSDPIVPAKTDEKTRGNKTTTEAKTKSSETCAVRKNKRTPFLGSIARNFQFFREWVSSLILNFFIQSTLFPGQRPNSSIARLQ